MRCGISFLAVVLSALALVGITACKDSSSTGTPTVPTTSTKPAAVAAPVPFDTAAFSIAVPADGFTWKHERELKDAAGKTLGNIYVAQDDKATATVQLTVQNQAAATDGQRVASLKGFYNGTAQTLQQSFNDLKASQPPVTPPIAASVSFIMNGAPKAGGERRYFHMTSHFGQRYTFTLQVSSADEKRAAELAKVAETIKEKPADK